MPGEDIYSWSTTAADNDDADTSINWREGQPRASVNDSARSLMAALAKSRTLLGGPTIAAGGVVNAYTFASGVGYTTIPTGLRVTLNNGVAVNTGASTLNMDSIAATPIKNRLGNDLVGGEWAMSSYGEFIYDGTNWRMLQDTGTLVTNTITTTGDVTVGGSITTTGNVTVGGTLHATYITDDVTITGSLLVGAISTFTSDANGSIWFFNPPPFGWYLHWQNVTGYLRYFAANVAVWQLSAGGDMYINGNGFKPGGGPWADSSDARVKNVVGNYTSGLAEIVGLNPVRYTFKGNDTPTAPEAGDAVPYKTSLHRTVATDGKEFIGVVAQDVEQHLPELVTQASGYIDGAEVNDVRMIDTTPLVYALVNCIKELAQRIEALEAKG